MDLNEIVLRLVGPIQPLGEHNADIQRLRNIHSLTDLIDDLLLEIRRAAENADRPEASMRVIGTHAKSYLEDLAATTDTGIPGKEEGS